MRTGHVAAVAAGVPGIKRQLSFAKRKSLLLEFASVLRESRTLSLRSSVSIRAEGPDPVGVLRGF